MTRIALASPEGSDLLAGCGEARRKALWLLAHGEAQAHAHACGLASAVIILNAIGAARPVSQEHQPHRLFTQRNVLSAPLMSEQVHREGMTLDDLSHLLTTAGAQVTTCRATGDPQTLFNQARERLESPHGYVIANFHSGTLYRDSGPGHFSPLGAYHPATGRWLVLDVARHLYQPSWVTSTQLWDALATTDSVSGKQRGLLLVDGRRLKFGLGELTKGQDPIVASAIHAGHQLRPEAAALIRLDDEARRREEDPYTDQIIRFAGSRIELQRSRFEVDVNRPRENAVYRSPAEAWGLEVWREQLPSAILHESLELYDAFYRVVETWLDELVAEFGGFVILDVHSYNHRRGGPGAAPADPALNPEIDIGTGSVNCEKWRTLIDSFIADLRQQPIGGKLPDVRENIKWPGIEFARRIHERFPTGCLLTIELKKTFMDEWTGAVNETHLTDIRNALAATLPGLRQSLTARSGGGRSSLWPA